ncbi:hypothetical protein [Vibrio aerogenes]|uniref:hypothetical protein n=1 Tax=Vibrio aerogenes TaxID=92172 RepID=UPI0009359E1D|nr:hypothetical protein [Vibrio aerogenes]
MLRVGLFHALQQSRTRTSLFLKEQKETKNSFFIQLLCAGQDRFLPSSMAGKTFNRCRVCYSFVLTGNLNLDGRTLISLVTMLQRGNEYLTQRIFEDLSLLDSGSGFL